jgi:hypothetical protein
VNLSLSIDNLLQLIGIWSVGTAGNGENQRIFLTFDEVIEFISVPSGQCGEMILEFSPGPSNGSCHCRLPLRGQQSVNGGTFNSVHCTQRSRWWRARQWVNGNACTVTWPTLTPRPGPTRRPRSVLELPDALITEPFTGMKL